MGRNGAGPRLPPGHPWGLSPGSCTHRICRNCKEFPIFIQFGAEVLKMGCLVTGQAGALRMKGHEELESPPSILCPCRASPELRDSPSPNLTFRCPFPVPPNTKVGTGGREEELSVGFPPLRSSAGLSQLGSTSGKVRGQQSPVGFAPSPSPNPFTGANNALERHPGFLEPDFVMSEPRNPDAFERQGKDAAAALLF